MSKDIPEKAKRKATITAAKKSLWDFCWAMDSGFYSPERKYLKTVCESLETFMRSKKRLLVINMPPRHGKSYTATHFVEWLLGINPASKIMTCSYGERLSTRFSRKVRDDIVERKVAGGKIVYSDIFPESRIRFGDATVNLWSLEGQNASYLATSPGSTATGFGATVLIIDDLIKNADEAMNETAKDRQWEWFTNTTLSRLEEGGKIIIVMTRWASDDLAGRALELFPDEDIIHLNMKAVQDDGTMLCDDVLSAESCEAKKRLMGYNIWSANYQQEPIDLKGRLYTDFKTYDDVPRDAGGTPLFRNIKCYIDTADMGNDYLCSIIYGEYNDSAYILDVYYTQDPMEITEKEVARRLDEYDVRVCDVESNNGGRGFARNVEELLHKRGNHKCRILWFHQSQNKLARILSNATRVMDRIFFPKDWNTRFPEYYSAMMKYQSTGGNAHDDAPDATTGVWEKMGKRGIKFSAVNLR